jgi:hypothetical protein
MAESHVRLSRTSCVLRDCKISAVLCVVWQSCCKGRVLQVSRHRARKLRHRGDSCCHNSTTYLSVCQHGVVALARLLDRVDASLLVQHHRYTPVGQDGQCGVRCWAAWIDDFHKPPRARTPATRRKYTQIGPPVGARRMWKQQFSVGTVDSVIDPDGCPFHVRIKQLPLHPLARKRGASVHGQRHPSRAQP